MTEAYPLAWPDGWPRTSPHKRQHTKFFTTGTKTYRLADGSSHTSRAKRALTIEAAMRRLSDELERLEARNIILSSNLERRLDGQPRSNQQMPDDPGVACYFTRNKQPMVLACDAWIEPAGNIAAIAGHIECIRAMDRYGVGTLDRVFTGYAALPAPGTTANRPWWRVLGLDGPITGDTALPHCEFLYRKLAKERHPDAPTGSTYMMAELNEAIAEARRALA